jgi:hypothetical protein
VSGDRETYRHRNSKNHWASKDSIHTFWVGQRVVRSGSRKNFVDQIDDIAIVTALPGAGSSSLTVERTDGTASTWSPTEATPYRVLLDNNRKRFAAVAKKYAVALKQIDENGNPLDPE